MALATFSAFGNIADFENAQRMAKALCSSSIVPETYRGEQHIGDCVIALEIANRIGANILAVMQNLYLVHGKPAWSSQFLISCVNASRKFSPLRYRMTGEKGNDTYGCIAWAEDARGEKLESPEVNIAMSKAEGWFSRNGSKWKTMPELMLRYRAATLFARLYAPELTMGIQTDDEVIDITPVVTEPTPKASKARFSRTTVEVPPAQAEPKPTPSSAPPADTSTPATPAQPGESGPHADMANFLSSHEVSLEDFLSWLKSTGRYPDADSVGTLADLPAKVINDLMADAKGQNRLVTLYGKASQ